jgi:hypothetical protein
MMTNFVKKKKAYTYVPEGKMNLRLCLIIYKLIGRSVGESLFANFCLNLFGKIVCLCSAYMQIVDLKFNFNRFSLRK